ncbi:cell death-inducing p53-target protein 1-like [Trichogramma pretiosum]|uniref:cell death-inducing p53-target protein 1-like n=1 Tax=Trichogramma pretiosum TaxID=7493 RepID=UPI0006C9BB03|nr:cell death-inducing p53-target protein 1-like [Trichogramma pretiosum]
MIQKQDEPPVNPFENGTSSSENLSNQAGGVAARSSSRSNEEATEKPPVNPFEDVEEPADPPREFAPVVNRPKSAEKISVPSVEQKPEEDEPAGNPFEDDEKQPLKTDEEGKEDVQLTATPVDDPPYHVPGVTYSTEPISLVCQKCKKTVMSEIRNVPSWKNRMAAQLLCYICCCCLSPCAYCDKDLQEKKHYCPDCHSFLGVYAK